MALAGSGTMSGSALGSSGFEVESSQWDAGAGFLVSNPIDRFGIGNMAETLEPDADGGLTLLIQHDSPGANRQTNWLPAPAEKFFLVMCMYQPQEQMYRGNYTVPPVTRTN
jgi:hypothetical protein